MQTTFQSYLDDLDSSTSCCRSASLLVPTKNNGTNDILRKMRQWKWICESVLIRPWRSGTTSKEKSSLEDDAWYYQYLPTEDELLFLQTKHSLPTTTPSNASRPQSQQKDLAQKHIASKSLLVPLTDDATAFILHVLFELPILWKTQDAFSNRILLSDPKQYEKAVTVQKWVSFSGITIVHNCDGNQTVSLSKEVDSFPESITPPSSTTTMDNHPHESNFTFADLFAGIGGFRIGMEALGGTCIGSCEIDPYARETYRRNFVVTGQVDEDERKEFFVNDITRLEIPPDTVDVICGGFPCQSFSTLANKNGIQGGLHTPHKGKLFFHLLRILRKARPKLFVFENVKGLMQLDHGSQFKLILHLLEESGYNVSYAVVDSSWFLPQRRERVYFVGVRLGLSSTKSPPLDHLQFEADLRTKYRIYNNNITNADIMDKYDRVLLVHGNHPLRLDSQHSLPTSRLGDILQSCETVSNQHSHCFLTPSQWEKVSNQGYIQLHADGSGRLLTENDACAQTLVSSYRQSYLMHSQFIAPVGCKLVADQNDRLVLEARKKKQRQEIEQYGVVTNTTHPTSKVENSNDQTLPRFFTPRECCRLQGFPEAFVLPFTSGDNKQRHFVSQFYRQIGNAVSPPCVAAVTEYALSRFIVTINKNQNSGERSGAIFDLILKASPNGAKGGS